MCDAGQTAVIKSIRGSKGLCCRSECSGISAAYHWAGNLETGFKYFKCRFSPPRYWGEFQYVFDFLPSPGWQLLTLAGFLWLGWNWIFRRRSKVEAKGPTWSLLGSAVIISFLFEILLAIDSTGAVPQTIVGWGTNDIHICPAQVDASKLMPFKKNYKLAVVCGYQDATKDRLEDEIVTVSNVFNIVSGIVQITTPTREGMVKFASDAIAQAQKSMNMPNVSVAMPTWYEVILLPNGVAPSKISKLADVLDLNGKIINSQYFN